MDQKKQESKTIQAKDAEATNHFTSRTSRTRRTSRTGILLVNLGTTDAPTTSAVRKFLREFLSDPRVMDISPLGRYFLVNLIIVPFRSAKTAKAYQEIWGPEGSPILAHGKELAKRVQDELDQVSPNEFVVKLGMRYGNPSISKALDEFSQENINRLRILPLFPQYASATVGSAIESVYSVASSYWNMPTIETLPPFYDQTGYLDSVAEVSREALADESFDYYLFSFHGLPERHIKKSERAPQDRCLTEKDCCAQITGENHFCYRAHCYATAREIASRLQLDNTKWSVSFQSRLGRDPWIKPYTDEVTKELPGRGIKSLAVFSPAFVADCLETLEELGLRGAEDFELAGGKRYKMIPALNTHPSWVKVVVKMVGKKC
ncbi:MAG: ferrochelatase [candidate division Zixibacteria bacterium]|nr:ferrochelatase [candidate division Zixibacteria bacterium]